MTYGQKTVSSYPWRHDAATRLEASTYRRDNEFTPPACVYHRNLDGAAFRYWGEGVRRRLRERPTVSFFSAKHRVRIVIIDRQCGRVKCSFIPTSVYGRGTSIASVFRVGTYTAWFVEHARAVFHPVYNALGFRYVFFVRLETFLEPRFYETNYFLLFVYLIF